MSFKDSYSCTSQSLERLEEFSTFTSCIKSFRKSIIPPLLTAEQRDETCRFRAAAIKVVENKEKKKKELSCASDEVKAVHCRVQEHLASCNKSDFEIYNKFENPSGALLATSVIDVRACPTNTGSNFSNEMHISTCKITSSNICSTVHKDVIIFPSVIKAGNYVMIPNCYNDQNETLLASCNVDSYGDSNKQDLFSIVSPMPHKSASNNNEEYLPKNETEFSTSVYNDKSEAQLSLHNADSCEIRNQQNLLYSVPALPYIIGPTNDPEYVPKSDAICSQGTIQLVLHNTDSYENSNEQDLPSMLSSMYCVSGPSQEMPYRIAPNSGKEYLHESNSKCPSHSDQAEAIFSLVSRDSWEDGNKQNLSSLESAMPNVSGPTKEISYGSGPIVKMPYESSPPAKEIPFTGGPTVEILGSGPTTEMPYGCYPTEDMASVSEGEHDSNTESLEFESLPTVISAGQFVLPQDTDNESNVTCLTQSTDLEKYLDSSIEYSSPDDARTLSRSRVSSQLNMSTRSDDASSETLINTGSESTPCASAMAILGYVDCDVVDGFSDKFINNAVVPQRASSVDSYMPQACPKKLQIRKSQSEPSYHESKQLPAEVNLESIKLDLKNAAGDYMQETTPISESEVFLSFEDAKKSLKRKHVRSNSYTLEHPSPALIMAHADCNCSKDSNNLSPHSCSSQKINFSTPNLAFKKEKVSIVLPPMQDRDKYFPILSSTSIIVNKTNTNTIIDTKISNVTDHPEVKLPEPGCVNLHQDKTISQSAENASIGENQVLNSTENSNKEHSEELPSEINNYDASSQKLGHQKERMNVSPENRKELNNNDITELLNQVIRDMKELQKSRVNQFFEEQNKLWFQMQEEFKEQERLLCQKLTAANISPSSDGALSIPHVTDMNRTHHRVIDNSIPVTNSNTNGPYLKTSYEETSEVESCKKSHFNSIPNATTLLNLKNTELSHENIHNSQSTTSLTSKTSTTEESESTPLPPNRSSSLTVFSGSLSTDSCDGSLGILSSVTSKSLNTQSQDMSSDKETIHSSTSFKSFTTQSQDLSSEKETIHSSMSSNSLNAQSQDLSSDKQETIHSSISETSTNADSKASVESMQSLYNNCPISLLNVPESSYSSISFRSSSGLSQTSDAAKMFRDFRFVKESGCSLVSPGKVCHRQEHRGRESIDSDCCSCLKCNSFSRRLYFDNLSDDGNRHFTTPISPAEFIPLPAVFQQQKSLTSTTLHALQFQNPDIAATNLKNNNSLDLGLLILHSPEATNSDQENLSNANLVPNVHRNLNNVPDINAEDDKSYSEDEIRAINDQVQSSYANSYPCQLNEKCRKAVIPGNNSNKNPSREQKSHGSFHIPFNAISSVEKGALKQNISSSLTNLKRRQSRDILKDPVLLKKFEKLPALVKGYLTRRLFKSERVQDLIRTLRDTALLVGKCSQELNSKGNSVSENDVEFHRQLIAQLMRTFDNVYDIFCTMSVGEQMKIIAESRNLRLKKKASGKKETEVFMIAEKCRSSPSKKPKLSAATIKALERKRSSIHSRTYLVEDLKGNKSRIGSNTTAKSHVLSPSRVYKASVGTSLKRKTTNVCKISPWK